MAIPFFDYNLQLKKINPEIKSAIKKVLNSGNLILGEEVKKFEKNFADYCGAKYGIGVNSGTDAIKIALRALEIKEDDEVITVANTAVPTVSAIRETGAIPIFVDIKQDFTIDENLIEKAITKKTKAILPVHLYGQACNMPAILKIVKKHKLKVIEDCAQAHGARINNKKVGTFGDIGCFSFYPTKNLGAYGDAGMIITNNKKQETKCRKLRMYGRIGRTESEIEGYNSRLDELQAAVLNVKLKYLEGWNKARRAKAKIYLEKIKNPNIIMPAATDIDSHSFHLFVVRVENRKKFIEYLNNTGIGFGIHYPLPIHMQTAYKFLGYRPGDLPKTEKFSKEIVSLPIFPELNEKEINFIINKLNQY